MPVTVVVGGQFGSEGKGKVAHYFARELNASVAIRCGGPNSGHTVIDPSGKPLIFQQLPTASIIPDISIVLCAGMYIDPDILFREIEIAKLPPERLFIDPNAVIITPEIKKAEKNSGLVDSIGSTGSGTGEAVVRRIKRFENVIFAKDEPRLSSLIRDTKEFVGRRIETGDRIILEGTQGFGLSLLHSPFYPYVTSRDTSAAGFVSEAGLSPLDVDDIILTIRSYPIRVGGNSGPLAAEINWETVKKRSGARIDLTEKTSVTGKKRRIAEFDKDIVQKAIKTNKPTKIVLNHLDYIDWKSRCRGISIKTNDFIENVKILINSDINYFGFGPSSNNLVSSK